MDSRFTHFTRLPTITGPKVSKENRVRSGLILAACALLFPIHLAKAQNTQEPESLPRPPASAPTEETSPFNINFSGAYSPRENLEGGGGISRSSWTGDASMKLPLIINPSGISVFGGLGFSYTGESYHFTGRPNIAGSDAPWNQVNIGTVSTSLFAKLNDRWGVFTGFSLTSAAASGADMEQSFTYGGVVGADYKVSDDLSVGIGVIAQSRLSQDVLVLPIPTFSWILPFDDRRWRLFSGGGPAGSGAGGSGPGVAIGLSYQPIKPLTLAGGFSSLGTVNDFRLSSRASVSNGVVRDEFTQMIFNVNYQPDTHLSLNAFIGVDLPGTLRVISSTGGQVYNENTGVAPVFGASVTWRF
jgi:hypothetical protein